MKEMIFFKTIQLLVFLLATTVCYAQMEGSGNMCSDTCVEGNGECDENDNCVCLDRWEGASCKESIYCNQSNSCNGGTCTSTSANNEAGFECNCTGTSFGGSVCDIKYCNSTTRTIGTMNVSFPRALYGEISYASTTCNSSGGSFDGKPIGVLKCEDDWQAFASIKDCEMELEKLPNNEQIEAIQALTSNPEAVKANDVTLTLKIFSEISSETTVPSEVDSLLITINNLLQVTDPEASKLVRGDSSAILRDLNNLATNVNTSTMVGSGVYENVETDISMIVLNDAISTNGAISTYETGSGGNSISLELPLQRLDGFRGASFRISNPKQTSHALYATTTSENRVSYQLFTTNQLFPDQTNMPESLIIGAQSEEQLSNLQMKFYLHQYRRNLTEYGFDPIDEVQFVCAFWDSSYWSENRCTLNAAETDNLYNYITCDCQEKGYFTITQKAPAGPTSPSGLSGGEIAGIVIGSVAGAALIIGGVVYATSKKKKKAKITNSRVNIGSNNNKISGIPEAMELKDADSSRTSTPTNKDV